jgi:response regulator RpfG family c-di-GMP phosphodiesterase
VLKSDPLTRDIPVIALTASVFAMDRKKFEEAGFDDFLLKPVNVRELAQKLEIYLDKKASGKGSEPQKTPAETPLQDTAEKTNADGIHSLADSAALELFAATAENPSILGRIEEEILPLLDRLSNFFSSSESKKLRAVLEDLSASIPGRNLSLYSEKVAEASMTFDIRTFDNLISVFFAGLSTRMDRGNSGK